MSQIALLETDGNHSGRISKALGENHYLVNPQPRSRSKLSGFYFFFPDLFQERKNNPANRCLASKGYFKKGKAVNGSFLFVKYKNNELCKKLL